MPICWLKSLVQFSSFEKNYKSAKWGNP